MSNPILEQILGDLSAEGDRLEQLVTPLSDAQWRVATPADGWDVAAQVSHLAWTDETAVAAAGPKEQWDALVMKAIEDPAGYVDQEALEGAKASAADLLARWQASRSALQQTLRDLPDGTKLPWFGPPMSATSMATARFMETWAHSLDVHEALISTGSITEMPEPTDRIKHVAHIAVRTRNYSYSVNQLPAPDEEFRVELVAPSGELWTWGPPGAAQKVSGPAYDLCRLATQRVHRDDTALVAVGADAEQWLTIAQCFAGPPGAGRAVRS
ncbi:TIGR03084 family metal-binding protein [Nocardioides alcanivorans]|uniref:TIGR03084 family metal-binding protein n=1 Tax=Nocardioides alcanivorans TaxID=2897352 RepID=UPI001F2035BB|nr:TIGR03084 family metal-binding protein [Nocardioides alcanivorans]